MIEVSFGRADGSRYKDSITSLLMTVRRPKALLEIAGRHMVNSEIPRIFREGGPPGQPWPPTRRGGRILVDTGRLRSSIGWRIENGWQDVAVGTNLKYARIHQLGGVIVGRPYLAIPNGEVLTRSQVRTARPKDFKGLLRVRKTNSPRVLLLGKSEDGEWKTYFFLVRSVRIPARPYLVFTDRALREIVRKWETFLNAIAKDAKLVARVM